MRLKVSNNMLGGRTITLSVDADINDLISTILKEYSDQAINVKSIRFGYPSKTIDITEAQFTRKLNDFGISSGEKIIFELNSYINKFVSLNTEIPYKDSRPVFTQLCLDHIEPGMVLQVHKMPDDNSCLFHALSYSVYKDITISAQLRMIVHDEITSNKEKYSDAILGKKNAEYAEWISQKNSWGGYIEIAILSLYMGMAVFVLDMDSAKYEKFNEDKFDRFVIILFNGVHYDSLEVTGTLKHENQTVFDLNDPVSELIMDGALSISSQMKEAGYSFNTYSDKIRCNICKKIMLGEREVARHAEDTGHCDFGQSL